MPRLVVVFLVMLEVHPRLEGALVRLEVLVAQRSRSQQETCLVVNRVVTQEEPRSLGARAQQLHQAIPAQPHPCLVLASQLQKKEAASLALSQLDQPLVQESAQVVLERGCLEAPRPGQRRTRNQVSKSQPRASLVKKQKNQNRQVRCSSARSPRSLDSKLEPNQMKRSQRVSLAPRPPLARARMWLLLQTQVLGHSDKPPARSRSQRRKVCLATVHSLLEQVCPWEPLHPSKVRIQQSRRTCLVVCKLQKSNQAEQRMTEPSSSLPEPRLEVCSARQLLRPQQMQRKTRSPH